MFCNLPAKVQISERKAKEKHIFLLLFLSTIALSNMYIESTSFSFACGATQISVNDTQMFREFVNINDSSNYFSFSDFSSEAFGRKVRSLRTTSPKPSDGVSEAFGLFSTAQIGIFCRSFGACCCAALYRGVALPVILRSFRATSSEICIKSSFDRKSLLVSVMKHSQVESAGSNMDGHTIG